MRIGAKELGLCRESVQGVLETLSRRFLGEDATDLVGPLARCASRLSDEPPPPAAEVAGLLRITIRASLTRMQRGTLPWGDVEPLTEALNASLVRSPDDHPLRAFRASPRPSSSPVHALTSPPGPLWLRSGPLLPPELKDQLSVETKAARSDFHEAPAEGTPPSGEVASPTMGSSETGTVFDPGFTHPPKVRFDVSRATSIPLLKHYALVTEDALDSIALLNRHRLERRVGEAHGEEVAILQLVDAAINAGPNLVAHAEHWWAENLSSPDEWRVWSPCFLLASIEDDAAPAAIDRMLGDLEAEPFLRVAVAAQALHLAKGSVAPLLREYLIDAPTPVKRAIGIEATSLSNEATPAQIEEGLADPSPIVLRAALRALARSRDLPLRLEEQLVAFLNIDRPSLVMEAARALLLHGRRQPYEALQYGNLQEALGQYLLDFLVWTGSDRDIPRVEHFVGKHEISGPFLVQIGLFGHPAMWRFLSHFLADDELQDDAVEALTILLGEGVPDEERFHAAAWERRLAEIAPDPDTRYRLGKPFEVRSLAEEFRLRRLSYWALQQRLDEMTIRSGVRVDTPLHGWVSDSEGRVQGLLEQLDRHRGTIPPGTWASKAAI